MKITTKLYLIMTTLICSTLYTAEPPTEAEFYGKIFSDWLVRTNNLDPATLKKVQQEEREKMRKEMIKSAIQADIRCGEKISKKTIKQADPETAALARKHNQDLQWQVQQPK